MAVVDEAALGVGQRHPARVHPERGGKPAVPEEGVLELREPVLRVFGAETLVDHELLGVVRPALAEGVAHEDLLDPRGGALVPADLDEVTGERLVRRGRGEDAEGAEVLGALRGGHGRLGERDVEVGALGGVEGAGGLDGCAVGARVGGRLAHHDRIVRGERDEPLVEDEAAGPGHQAARDVERRRLAEERRLHFRGERLVGRLVCLQVRLVHGDEIGERCVEPLLDHHEAPEARRAEHVAVVAARRLLRKESGELLRLGGQRLVGAGEARLEGRVAEAAELRRHLAAEVRGVPGVDTRGDRGERLRQRRDEVLVDVGDLGERRLFVRDEAPRALLARRVVDVDVGAHGEEGLIEARALLGRLHVVEPEDLRVERGAKLGKVERVVGRQRAGVERAEIGARLARARHAGGDRVARELGDLRVVLVEARDSPVLGRVVEELTERAIAERREGGRAGGRAAGGRPWRRRSGRRCGRRRGSRRQRRGGGAAPRARGGVSGGHEEGERRDACLRPIRHDSELWRRAPL